MCGIEVDSLVQLLGGYFHEDWVLDHGTAEECLDHMLEEAPLEQQRRGAAEIAGLLRGEICENQIRDLRLYEVGCAYAFENDGYDASSWLRHVHGRLLDSIARRENGTSGVQHAGWLVVSEMIPRLICWRCGCPTWKRQGQFPVLGGDMAITGGATEFRMEVPVNAPIERSFRVFVERCHDWWPPEHRLGETDRVAVVLEPRVDGRWFERTSDGRENEWGRVLEWNPPDRVSLSWQIGLGFVPEPNPNRASRVDVVFVPTGPDRTQVTLVHSEFERHGDGWDSMREAVSNDRGWPGILPAFAQLAASAARV